jgi:formylglycine-generating enzyme required for sulfatase activity/tRNA A-37 threonylcarbamoyl transferase component Bud32
MTIPKKIGRYEVKEEIGRGGMAAVYRAYDPEFKRDVAVKVILQEAMHDPRFRERFKREAQTVASLEHPAIVPVYDFGEQDGQPYLVMRYMGGGSLREYLRSRAPLSLQEAAQILTRLAPALDKAHSAGIIHRDLKPANIIFDEEGNPYLSDFGIVKLAKAQEELTSTGAVVGTPAYMSPEQGRAEKELDGRSDVYSLAVILFEMLTGQQPYKADTPVGLMVAHINDPIPDLAKVAPDLPQAAQRVIERGMAKNREARFSTSGEMAAALATVGAGISTGGVSVEENATFDVLDTPAPIFKEEAEKHTPSRWMMWIGLIVVVGVLCLGAVVVGGLAISGRLFPDKPAATDMVAEEPEPTAAHGVEATEAATAVVGVVATAAASPVAPTNTARPTEIPASDATEPAPTEPPVALDAGTIQTNPLDGAAMVFIPAGEFTMGLTDDQADKVQRLSEDCNNVLDLSQPAHAVYLDAYWIYQNEVTIEMYKACVAAGACEEPDALYSDTRADYYTNAEYGNYPVVWVNWQNADAYCEWAGGGLPTEAQWEKAARGGDGRLFPWGDTLPIRQLANVDNFIGDTMPVDSYAKGASPYGVLNMAGNVYEWVADWFSSSYYEMSPYENPTGPSNLSGELERRVVRGGNFGWDLGCACSATHDWWEGYESGTGVGFRCAQTP